MLQNIPITQVSEKQKENFSCGVSALDVYLRQFAKGIHVKNIGKTFVLLEHDKSVIGYYTTSMGSVNFMSLPPELSAKLPRYPIPIARIARLAVDTKQQGQQWGKFLLVDALCRICEAAYHIGAVGVVVDAKDKKAKAFYSGFGFISFADNDLCLFLPMEQVLKLSK